MCLDRNKYFFVYGYEFLIGFVPKYQDIYLDSIYGQGRGVSASLFLGITAILYCCYNNFKIFYNKENFNRIKLFNIFVVLIYGILLIASYKIFILSRLVIYFELLLCLVIPYCICNLKKSFKVIGIGSFTILSLIYLSIYLTKNLGDVVPYVSRL